MGSGTSWLPAATPMSGIHGTGYVFDFLVRKGARIGAGVYASMQPIDSELDFVYGRRPELSGSSSVLRLLKARSLTE